MFMVTAITEEYFVWLGFKILIDPERKR